MAQWNRHRQEDRTEEGVGVEIEAVDAALVAEAAELAPQTEALVRSSKETPMA